MPRQVTLYYDGCVFDMFPGVGGFSSEEKTVKIPSLFGAPMWRVRVFSTQSQARLLTFRFRFSSVFPTIFAHNQTPKFAKSQRERMVKRENSCIFDRFSAHKSLCCT